MRADSICAKSRVNGSISRVYFTRLARRWDYGIHTDSRRVRFSYMFYTFFGEHGRVGKNGLRL